MIAPAPPRPRANPVLGWALELRRSQIRTYERVMREQGDVVRLVVGPPGLRFDLYMVFHPDGVKSVLAGSREAYSKGNRFYLQIAEAFGWGLLTSEGELWQRQRRLIQPLFTRREIATYSALMAEEAAAVAERWDRARRNGGSVDANADMVGLALRVVGRAIFGDDLAKASDVLDQAFPVLNRHTFRRAMSPLASQSGGCVRGRGSACVTARSRWQRSSRSSTATSTSASSPRCGSSPKATTSRCS